MPDVSIQLQTQSPTKYPSMFGINVATGNVGTGKKTGSIRIKLRANGDLEYNILECMDNYQKFPDLEELAFLGSNLTWNIDLMNDGTLSIGLEGMDLLSHRFSNECLSQIDYTSIYGFKINDNDDLTLRSRVVKPYSDGSGDGSGIDGGSGSDGGDSGSGSGGGSGDGSGGESGGGSGDGQNGNYNTSNLFSQKKVLPRFELGSRDSESRVLTATP
eukprot:sb/3469985/